MSKNFTFIGKDKMYLNSFEYDTFISFKILKPCTWQGTLLRNSLQQWFRIVERLQKYKTKL